jgi:hypothetical protein
MVCPLLAPLLTFTVFRSVISKPKSITYQLALVRLHNCLDDLRTDDTNKKIHAWMDTYFLTYFHCKLCK